MFLLILICCFGWIYVTADPGCPRDYHLFEERCIFLSPAEGSWAESMKICTNMGGKLAMIDNQDLQMFVTNLVQTLNKGNSITFNTGNDYIYHYLHDLGVDIRNHTSITFNVTACNDVHVALSSVKNLDTLDTYEIVIGGWSDSESVIRDCKQCEHMDQIIHMSHPVDCSEAKPFWISWSNNYIRVGTGNIVGENQFMSWNDTDPHAVNYVAIATGWGATGAWTFLDNRYIPGKFWVGAMDLVVENEWLWLPTQTPITEYTNWVSGQPDNAEMNQHCMVMDMQSNMKWRDDNCEEKRNFICERPVGGVGSIIGRSASHVKRQ